MWDFGCRFSFLTLFEHKTRFEGIKTNSFVCFDNQEFEHKTRFEGIKTMEFHALAFHLFEHKTRFEGIKTLWAYKAS